MAKHQREKWKGRLYIFSSIAKLAKDTFRAIHYFQQLSQELTIRQDISEILDFLTSFFSS